MTPNTIDHRAEACRTLIRQARTIIITGGAGAAALEKIKVLLLALADRG